MNRQPAVAGRFYPGSGGALSREIATLFPAASAPPQEAIAVVSPHAGYMYSGSVAAETLGRVIIPETVVILGLNHHGRGEPIALSQATWNMPMGEVAIDPLLSELLLQPDGPITADEFAHLSEHSVEVQVPFLQALQPALKIVPLVISHISYSRCEELAETLVSAIQNFNKPVLVVASSDMTHYESREKASVKDRAALACIERLDPRDLYDVVHTKRISMCGVIPVTVALLVAQKLGANRAELVRYTDSGEVSGDIDQVVGYAGVIIS